MHGQKRFHAIRASCDECETSVIRDAMMLGPDAYPRWLWIDDGQTRMTNDENYEIALFVTLTIKARAPQEKGVTMAVVPERMDHCWPREYIMIITGRREAGVAGWYMLNNCSSR